MEKIANLDDIKKGGALYFEYQGKKSILIRTKEDNLVAYIAICPHEGGSIEWDETINIILCECHLSLFRVNDGSVYRHSTAFELNEGLTKIDVQMDEENNIFAI
jgi:nitrite reductase/ring-hydroxylating ferredoxin subunit